jgi:glycosyltransferase involved in cell wall biosynthesis
MAAELVAIPTDEADFRGVQRSYLAFWDLDLSGFDGLVSTKAPSYAARHPNHVCYLMHTMRVFYDMFAEERPSPSPEDLSQRALVHRLDRLALSPPRLRSLFAIGEEVRQRLLTSLGLNAKVVRHPSTLTPSSGAGAGRYLLMPGRLHRWKRVELAIAAMRHVAGDTELLITGTGEDAVPLQRLAAGDRRIRFLGRVSELDLAQLYAGALAVLFVPKREDLGLVTLEAFAAGRPVVTCEDSGEPARLVRHNQTGLVVQPEAHALGAAIRMLAADSDLASRLGAAGQAEGATVTWARVGQALAAALAPGFARLAS